jgi:hypothetical protein
MVTNASLTEGTGKLCFNTLPLREHYDSGSRLLCVDPFKYLQYLLQLATELFQWIRCFANATFWQVPGLNHSTFYNLVAAERTSTFARTPHSFNACGAKLMTTSEEREFPNWSL